MADKDLSVNQVELADLKSTTTKDGDLQVYAAEFSARSSDWHAQIEKRVLRKVDWHMMPWIILMYLTNFLDRTALAQAKLGSLERDLNLKGVEFNTITAILFVGYITLQIPSNLLLTKVRPGLYLCSVMAVWGGISAAQAATHSYAGELLCRLALGAAEAPFFSGCIFLMSSWYKSNELAHRIALLYSGVALANAFGGLIAAGVLPNLNMTHGIAGWRWLFIIEGTATTGIALIAVWFMPNYPDTTRWLSSEERHYAMWRVAKNAAGEEDDRDAVTVWQAIRSTFADYKVYLFMLLNHGCLLSQSFTYFFPSIVKSLGFSGTTTLLLTAPVWFATLFFTLLISWHSSRTAERSYHIAACMCVAAVGNIIMITTRSVGARMFAMYLLPIGVQPAFMMILAWITSTFARPMSKRAVVVATAGAFGNMASIYGSYMYPNSDGPYYTSAGVGLICICLFAAGLAVVIRFVLTRENKKLESEAQQLGEDVSFRYIL